MFTEKNKVIIHLVSGLVILISLVAVGFASYYFGKTAGEKEGAIKAKAESQAEIEKLSKTVDVFVPPVPSEVYLAMGKVKSLNDGVLIAEINSVNERSLPGTAPKLETVSIKTNQETSFVSINLSLPPAPPKPGMPFSGPKETAIKFADIKVGDTIVIQSKENLKNKTEFTASKIQLQISDGVAR